MNHISIGGAVLSISCSAEPSTQVGMDFTLDVVQGAIQVGSALPHSAFITSTVVTESLIGPMSFRA